MKLQLTLPPEGTEEDLKNLCKRKFRGPLRYFKILKKSLDARKKSDIRWVYTVECDSRVPAEKQHTYAKIGKKTPKVVIAGAGPAGLFCAVRLIKHGIAPLVVERGKPVEERARDVENFFRTGMLDTNSNVQFGEGGAGTFSDGKLNTQTNTPFNREVIETFLEFGAPEEIGYSAKPHIGSDKLKTVVANMRKFLLENGAEIMYSTLLEDVKFRDGALDSVKIGGGWREADELVLAVGHSARDTFEMLLSRGFLMEQKEFAVGMRIEHLQENIGKSQYGPQFRLLPPADYKLVSHAGERAAFTFCMCPGGVVIPSASEEGGVVTNGMSNFAREGRNANSALVVQVKREDFGGEHPLAGVEYQRKLERAAYLAGGGRFLAPVQRVEDFLAGRESKRFGEVLPTYSRGTAFAEADAYLPAVIVNTMRSALPDMDAKLHGFASPDALLTGVESRTSSPVRIVRGEDLQAVGRCGVYPCGEGCGYAGGITSSAADGLRVAEKIFSKYL